MYIINVAAKLELFLGYSVVAVLPSSHKVIFGGLKAFFVNQDYNRDCNLFTEDGIMGYIIQVSFSPPHSCSVKSINSFRKCVPK